MAFEVHITEAFEDDVKQTLSYLEDSLGSPKAAESLMASIDDAVELLAEQPFLHAVSKRSASSAHPYRIHSVKNYVIAYAIKGAEVWLLRLFHQAQLYERFISDWS